MKNDSTTTKVESTTGSNIFHNMARVNLLETAFVVRVLAAMLLILQGGLRVRGDGEQLSIWRSSYQYPARLMPMYGATQVLAAVLTIFVPFYGLPVAVAMATTELLNHSRRQGTPVAGIFDVAVMGMALLLSLVFQTTPVLFLAAGAAGGASVFFGVLHRRFPLQQRKR